MSMCLLKINGLVVSLVELHRSGASGLDVTVQDTQFGEILLTPACLIEYLDVLRPERARDVSGVLTWRRLTYDEFIDALRPLADPVRRR